MLTVNNIWVKSGSSTPKSHRRIQNKLFLIHNTEQNAALYDWNKKKFHALAENT